MISRQSCQGHYQLYDCLGGMIVAMLVNPRLKTPIEDLPKIAQRLRRVVIVLSVTLIPYLFQLFFLFAGVIAGMPITTLSRQIAPFLAVLIVVLKLSTIVVTVSLLRAFREPKSAIFIQAWLVLMPFMDIATLSIIVFRIRTALANEGIRVGWLWVSDADVAARLSGHACRQCGYSLTGNVSGVCPECGSVIRDRLPSRLSEGDGPAA